MSVMAIRVRQKVLAPRARWMIIAAVVLLYLVPALWSTYRLTQIDEIVSFCLVVIGLNITMAVAGQDVIGLAAAFSFAGFCIAVPLQSAPHMTLAGMCVIGVVSAGLLGALLALPTLRVAGFYLGLTTIFLAELIPQVAQYWSVTGGQVGINLFVVAGFSPLLSGWTLYAVLLTGALLATFFLWLLISSPLGRRFAALRSSEELTQSLGITPYVTKIVSVVLGAAFCGVGAAMYVYSQQFFAPGSASVTTVILALAALVIGGAGTVWGPLIGSAIVFGLNSFISFSDYGGIVFGLLLLLFVMFAPGGAKDLVKIRGVAQRMGAATRRRAQPGAATVADSGRLGAQFRTGGAPPARPPEAGAVAARENGAVGAGPVPGGGPEPGPDLRVIAARKAFGGVVAVADADLTVSSGEVHGLIGSNGSGKTTLLNLITGYYTLDAGQILLGATPLSGKSPHAIARRGVARSFQTPKIIANSTALDNVLIAVEQKHRAGDIGSLLRVGAARAASQANLARAAEALARVGLENRALDRAGDLSHGNQRLVEIARCIAFEPTFMLMDEPGAGLSPAELDVLKLAIRGLASYGIGVLLVEHNIPMVLEVASRITAMHEGTVLFDGPPDELRRNPRIADAFLGETLRAEFALDEGGPK